LILSSIGYINRLYSIEDNFMTTWTHTAGQVGDVIATARRHRGLTQAQLAREMGVTQAWISQIEQGKDNAQIGKILRVLAYLGVRLRVGEAPWEERPSSDPAGPDLSRVIESLSSRPAARARKSGR
jgi:y4mF family transcriptional regulator